MTDVAVEMTLSNRAVIETIKQHIPSLSDEDEQAIYGAMTAVSIGVENADVADLAIRTCRCGEQIDGYYSFVDHLISVFGGESHFGG